MEQKKFNYCNYQIYYLHQNVDDFNRDILNMKEHISIIHERMKKENEGHLVKMKLIPCSLPVFFTLSKNK